MNDPDNRQSHEPIETIPAFTAWDDEPDPHPVRRRIFRIAYIVIVILVIAGLILMLFPWRPERVPFLPDLPWQTLQVNLLARR